jgi:MoxR-like ATPase
MPTQTYNTSENGAASAGLASDNLKYNPIRTTAVRTTPPAFPGASTSPTGGQNAGIQAITDAVQQASAFVRPLQQEIGRIIVGQNYLVQRLMIGLLANGHLLLEGVPGLAKTLSLRTLAGAIQAKFQRIQFTPDMLPADIVGTLIYNPRDGSFETKHGPIFANLVLADEINRAPAKVQSALLEAMAERQVTLGNDTYLLPEPFLVMATQNPIEQEGTYQLPEAQVDRFMLKLVVGYPNRTEELAIQDSMSTTTPNLGVNPVVTVEDILRAREVVNTIYIDQKVREYIVDLVLATRDPKAYGLDIGSYIQYGASPRGTINLTIAAKAAAFLQGRGYVTPQDVKSLALDVLRHRVTVSYEAEAEDLTSESVVQKIIETVPVP